MKKLNSYIRKNIIYVAVVIGFIIIIIFSKFLFIPKLSVAKDIDALSLWIEIYGGIVALFMAIAFINMFISKKEFDQLKRELEKKSIQLDNTYKNKVKEVDKIINEQGIILKDYGKTIDTKTNFIINYTRYLTAEDSQKHSLIQSFEEDLEFNNSEEIYEILTNLCLDTVGMFHEKLGILNDKIFAKSIRYLNEWIIHSADEENFNIRQKINIVGMYIGTILSGEYSIVMGIEEIAILLEKTRINFMKNINLENYKEDNIVMDRYKGYLTYIKFLENQIDFQIYHHFHGSKALINQLFELMELEYSTFKLHENQIKNFDSEKKRREKDKPKNEDKEKSEDDFKIKPRKRDSARLEEIQNDYKESYETRMKRYEKKYKIHKTKKDKTNDKQD